MGIDIHGQLIENPTQESSTTYGISLIRHVHTSILHWTRNCALVQMVAAVQSAMAFGLDTDAPPHARSSSLLLSYTAPRRRSATTAHGRRRSGGCNNVQPYCTGEIGETLSLYRICIYALPNLFINEEDL